MDYGIDLNSDFNFQDGDINIIGRENNLAQAICNRLNTLHNSLFYFYKDYGSIFHYFLGWKNEDETLNFMKSEIEGVLKKDPRISTVTADVIYSGEGVVKIKITINNNDTINLSLDENNLLTAE